MTIIIVLDDVMVSDKKETKKEDLSTDDGWWRDYELYEMQTD